MIPKNKKEYREKQRRRDRTRKQKQEDSEEGVQVRLGSGVTAGLALTASIKIHKKYNPISVFAAMRGMYKREQKDG